MSEKTITYNEILDKRCPICHDGWGLMKLTEQSKHRLIGHFCESCYAVFIYDGLAGDIYRINKSEMKLELELKLKNN